MASGIERIAATAQRGEGRDIAPYRRPGAKVHARNAVLVCMSTPSRRACAVAGRQTAGGRVRVGSDRAARTGGRRLHLGWTRDRLVVDRAAALRDVARRLAAPAHPGTRCDRTRLLGGLGAQRSRTCRARERARLSRRGAAGGAGFRNGCARRSAAVRADARAGAARAVAPLRGSRRALRGDDGALRWRRAWRATAGRRRLDRRRGGSRAAGSLRAAGRRRRSCVNRLSCCRRTRVVSVRCREH